MENVVSNSIGRESLSKRRIKANLQVRVSWKEEIRNETVSVRGNTESLDETTALVNLDVLPLVGSLVTVCLRDEGKTIIETQARVIRVVRDPGRQLAALAIEDNLDVWRSHAVSAAINWVEKDIKLNYEDEWTN